MGGTGEGRRTRLPAEFEAWFRDSWVSIYRYAARRLGTAAAEDICSQTFVEAWEHRDRFDPTRGTPRAWLFGIATNQIRRHQRTETRRLRAYARSAVASSVGDDVDGLADRADAHAAWPAIAAGLAGLRPADRDLVWMQASGLSYAEIAEAADIPIGTVRSRLSRARRKLGASSADRGSAPTGETAP